MQTKTKALKSYTVTHRVTGGTSCHVGYGPTRLTAGSVKLETLANAHYVPKVMWSPDPSQWLVQEQ